MALMASLENNQISNFFNVGGCLFSIPLGRLSLFQDSLLFKEALAAGQGSRLFIDRDGCTFRHVHYYMHTGKLASSCTSEVNILYEQAAGLHLTSLQQALENLRSGKHFLRARPEDLQVTERATLNYWKTRICNPRLSDPMTSPVSTVHDAIPSGLVGPPLVDSDEEVHYCFLPLDQVRLHPGLVTQDNLLWLCEDVVVIECGSRLFRFLANFLHTGKIQLPEHFHDYETLKCEAEIVGITEFTEALQDLQGAKEKDDLSIQDRCPGSRKLPLYAMTFNLLVKYPDSSLGQLYVDSNEEGSKVYITGSGVIFQHVENWLGTCHLPLTETASQQGRLREYLEGQDELYLAFKEAVWDFFHRKASGRSVTTGPWSASVATFTIYKVIKVYVGTHWYATYLKTLLKYPELLSNTRKVSWIAYGQSLCVKGDGLMFRHILNFLRCGGLMLPAEFSEWPLLQQEIDAFHIPALSDALKDCAVYRDWRKTQGSPRNTPGSSEESLLIYDEDKDQFVRIIYEEDLQLGTGQAQWDSGSNDSATPDITDLQSSSFSRADICEHPHSDTADRKEQIPLSNGIDTSGVGRLLASPEKQEQLVEDGIWAEHCAGTDREGQWDSWLTADQPTGSTEHLGKRCAGTDREGQCDSRRTADHLPKQNQDRQPGTPTQPSAASAGGGTRERGTSREPQLSQWDGQLHTSALTGRGQRSGSCVLRVLHPPVIGKGGASCHFTESIIYKATPPHTGYPSPTTQDLQNIAFVCFNMTNDNMLSAREFHTFLAGIILDSERLKDPRSSGLKMAGLVYSLWTEQAEPEDFVVELMKHSCYERQKHIQDWLLQWVKHTLRLAKQYSECIELLGEAGCQRATLFPED